MPDQVRRHKILAALLLLPKAEPPLSNSMVAVVEGPGPRIDTVSLMAPAAHLSRVSNTELGI